MSGLTIGLAVGGWFACPVIGRLVAITSDHLKDEISWWKGGMKAKLDQMNDNRQILEAVVNAALSQQIDEGNSKMQAFNNLLQDLKNALYEADNVLDAFEYERLEKRVNKSELSFASYSTYLKKKVERVLKQDTPSNRLRDVIIKLSGITDEVKNYNNIFRQQQQQQQQQQDDHYEPGINGSEIFGRESQKEEILEWLRKPTDDNISLFSLVGLGGMGKTSLANLIYDSATVDQDFELKIWISVSESADVNRITREIYQNSTNEMPTYNDIHRLQKELTKMLKPKKFMLVLDDVWDDIDIIKWEKLLAPIRHGKSGSKILLTTRMESVAVQASRALKEERPTLIKLNELERNEYLSLFNHYAFAGENPNLHKKLLEIGEEIADKLGGHPLATKLTGHMLNSNLDDVFWSDISKKEGCLRNEGGDIVMRNLRLSYNNLPLHLKLCFCYCSIFPKDYEFDRDDLVRMWVGAGLVEDESTGRNYFDCLVRKSFFEKPVMDQNIFDEKCSYKMHDLIRELAQEVASQECYVAKDAETAAQIPHSRVRHLYLDARYMDHMLKNKNVWEFKNLCTLVLSILPYEDDRCYSPDDMTDNFSYLLEMTKYLRVLQVDVPNLSSLPQTIGNLIHLRYLKVQKAKVDQIPESLCNLYHLLYFIYVGAWRWHPKQIFLPAHMSRLTNLRHITVSPENDHKLTLLKELESFPDQRYDFGQLGNLKELQEVDMFISKISVKDVRSAREARFIDKPNLQSLTLKFDKNWRRSGCLDEQLLDHLQPNKSLKILRISFYQGSRSAAWMQNPLYALEMIDLSGCSEWETLPCLGQLPCLKYLRLYNMQSVKELDRGFHLDDGDAAADDVFPSLKEFHIVRMESLEGWFDTSPEGESSNRSRGSWFPCLQKLVIHECHKLKSLPSLPSNLTNITITHCNEITHLPPAKVLAELPNLEELKIAFCPKLYLIGLQALRSLKNFTVFKVRSTPAKS